MNDLDWNLYTALIESNGKTEREELLNDTKAYFLNNAKNNLGYKDDVYYNGEKTKRRFIIQRSESYNKVKVVSFPDEPLYSGDILQCDNEMLIVTATYLLNDVQTVGIAWISNLNLRFQNGTSDIIEIPAALDDGTYSTTVGSEKNIQYLNKKMRIYVPYNDDTKKIFIDKRLAIEVTNDKYFNPQLVVYKVVGINHSSVSFGKGSHLLELTIDSDTYSPSNDNIDEMICDYISPTDAPNPTQKLKCEIKGRPTVLLNNYRIYTPIFYDENNQEVTNIVPLWTLSELNGITSEIIDNKLKIVVNDNEDFIGSVVTLTLQDNDGVYEPCSMEVEVTV